MPPFTRRQFGQAAAAAWIGTAVGGRRVLGANDRVRLGFIGLGNRGDQVLDAFLKHPDAEVVAVCDIYQPYLDFAAQKVGGAARSSSRTTASCSTGRTSTPSSSTRPTTGTRCRRSTPARRARTCTSRSRCRSCVAKGRAMVDAARRTKRVVQVGMQRRSSPLVREAAELVRSGAIGKVTVVRVVPHPERVAEGHRQPAGRAAARRTSTGTPGSARPRSVPTTRTAPSTASAGSTTTPAASSRTSACTTWT